MFNINVKWYGM